MPPQIRTDMTPTSSNAQFCNTNAINKKHLCSEWRHAFNRQDQFASPTKHALLYNNRRRIYRITNTLTHEKIIKNGSNSNNVHIKTTFYKSNHPLTKVTWWQIQRAFRKCYQDITAIDKIYAIILSNLTTAKQRKLTQSIWLKAAIQLSARHTLCTICHNKILTVY